ncbi:MAG TPA: ankyrin repeat domain-containing protein [Trebonia sp.]|nr:ankyrin repeat domain-containing protein [Trebonia sp.]
MASRRTHDIPLGRLLRAAPGLPTTDMARTIAHYERLGFAFGVARPADPGAELPAFAIGERDGVELHFALKPDHDPARTATWAYIAVADADELSAELDAAGAGQGRVPRDTGYRMRELAHVDPDGNLLLFGSPLRDEPAGEAGASAPVASATGAGPASGSVPAAAGDGRAFEFAAAVRRGDAGRVRELLGADPGLATTLINSRTPLHLFADAPGHRPNPGAVVSALVAAGANLDAHATGTWHHETALHWAASNDDVELIDALLDAGADIEHPGSSIGGGPPAGSALGYAQWNALRRLHERGAAMNLSRAAALGLMPLVAELAAEVTEVAAGPDGADPGGEPAGELAGQLTEELSLAFWNACRAGQLAAARYLAARGADTSWRAPWSDESALDAARAQDAHAVVTWLTGPDL